MSSIPPAGHAGLIQAHGAQRRATETRARQAAGEAQRTDRDTFSDKLKEVIENDDLDSQVYSDAEGAGSQGKQYADGETDAEADLDADADAPPPEPPAPGLDIQA